LSAASASSFFFGFVGTIITCNSSSPSSASAAILAELSWFYYGRKKGIEILFLNGGGIYVCIGLLSSEAGGPIDFTTPAILRRKGV